MGSSKLGVKRKCLVLNRMDVEDRLDLLQFGQRHSKVTGLDLALCRQVEATGPSHLPSGIFLTTRCKRDREQAFADVDARYTQILDTLR